MGQVQVLVGVMNVAVKQASFDLLVEVAAGDVEARGVLPDYLDELVLLERLELQCGLHVLLHCRKADLRVILAATQRFTAEARYLNVVHHVCEVNVPTLIHLGP